MFLTVSSSLFRLLSRSIMCVWERTIQQACSSTSCSFSFFFFFWWRRSHRSTICCRRPTVQVTMVVLYVANLPPVNNTSWQGYTSLPCCANARKDYVVVFLLERLKISFEQKRVISFSYLFFSLNECTLIKGSSAYCVAMAFFSFSLRLYR